MEHEMDMDLCKIVQDLMGVVDNLLMRVSTLEQSTEQAPRKTRAGRGKRAIDDTDAPTEKCRNLATKWRLDVGHEWGKFKNYCLAHDARYANFESAFRNWLANAYERKMKGAA